MQLSAFDNGASKGPVEPHAAISVFHDNKEGRHDNGEVSGGLPLPSGTTHLTCQMSRDPPNTLCSFKPLCFPYSQRKSEESPATRK